MAGLLLQGSEAVAEVEFERVAGLQALGEQGGRAGLGRVGGDQLAEPDCVGADRVRGSGSRDGTRKTCGSLLAALDVHPRVAMQILRHSKIAVTMEIYTKVPSAATRDALRKLGQLLGS